MQVKFDNGCEPAFDITTPATMPQWDISTMWLGRHGGETAADHEFRRQLYQRIGAVTVAAATPRPP